MVLILKIILGRKNPKNLGWIIANKLKILATFTVVIIAKLI